MSQRRHAGTAAPVQPFPGSFWTANVTELFERAAYYSMASFVVIYLGQLGFGSYWPSFLNSSVLWFLVFFLPILSGTIADQIGFRRALLVAFVLLAVGYFLMGYPVWFGGSDAERHDRQRGDRRRRATPSMIVGAILLIGIGGSVIKPCISGTVQKMSGARATLGFAIFYMVINIGSLFGRGTAFVVRSGSGVGTILAVVAVCALAAAGIVMLVHRTTKADRSRADIWVATAGFTAIVVAAAAARRLDLRRRRRPSASGPARRACPTSSRWRRWRRSWRSSWCCSPTGSRRSARARRRSRGGRSAGSCSTWCWCCGTAASRCT